MTKVYAVMKDSLYLVGRSHTDLFAVYSSRKKAYDAIQKIAEILSAEEGCSELSPVLTIGRGVVYRSTSDDGDMTVDYRIRAMTLNEDFL